MQNLLSYKLLTLLVLCIVSGNLQADNCIVTEVTVKDYPFMNEVANLIDQTTNITEQRIKKYRDSYYRIEIYSRNDTSGNFLSTLPFHHNGSYLILVELIDELNTASPYNYMFSINSLKFLSHQNLIPYYTSCKRERGVLNFKDHIITSGIYWHVFIKDGQIEKAYFLNSEYDDPAYNTVYDLISGETMIESEVLLPTKN